MYPKENISHSNTPKDLSREAKENKVRDTGMNITTGQCPYSQYHQHCPLQPLIGQLVEILQ